MTPWIYAFDQAQWNQFSTDRALERVEGVYPHPTEKFRNNQEKIMTLTEKWSGALFIDNSSPVNNYNLLVLRPDMTFF